MSGLESLKRGQEAIGEDEASVAVEGPGLQWSQGEVEAWQNVALCL